MADYIDSFKEFYKNNKLLAIVLIVSVVLVVGLYLLSTLPKKDALTGQESVTSEPATPTFGNLPQAPKKQPLIFQGTPSATQSYIDESKLALPTTARVYKFAGTSTLTPSIVDKVAVILGFKTKWTKEADGKYAWVDGQNYLSYDPVKDGFVFSLSKQAIASRSADLSRPQVETVKDLLSRAGFDFPDLQLAKANPTEPFDDLTIFYVPRVVNDIEARGWPFDPYLVSFTFNRQNQLTGGVFYYHLLQSGGQSYGVYPLKTVDEALADVKSGKATLAELGIKGYATVDIKGITGFNTTDVKLYYYEGRTPTDFMRPIYAFSGEVILIDGQKTTATYIVDALK